MLIYSLDAWISGSARNFSENNDRIADANQVLDAHGVPIGEPNAAVTGGAADGFRIIRAVNSDAWLVQAHPKHANQIVRPGREIEIIFGAHAVVEHALIVAEPGPGRGALNFPSADRRR